MLAKKLRDMHALAGDSCDPEYNKALLEAAAEIERLEAVVRRRGIIIRGLARLCRRV